MYKHTQIGWGIIILLGLTLVFLNLLTPIDKTNSFIYIVLIIVIIMFSKLTITIDENFIKLEFGLIGFPRRTFKLSDVESCQMVKSNMFAIGIGIHFGFNNSVYNVSGPHAVELTMKNGRKVYIGTDEPKKLETTIEESIK